MKTKIFNYSQGPYQYRRDKDGCDECYDIIDGDGGTVLASLPFWDDEDETIEATARLFASAPELAETLDAVIDQIRDLTGESSVIDEDLMQGEAFAKAIALLARLKG
jgi:hypothetical protein